MHRSPTRSSRFDPSSPSGGEGTGGRREGGGERGGGGRRESVSTRTSVPSTPVYPRSTDLDDFPKPLAVSRLYTYMYNTKYFAISIVFFKGDLGVYAHVTFDC